MSRPRHFALTLGALALGLSLNIDSAEAQLTQEELWWCQQFIDAGDIESLAAIAANPADPRSMLAAECLQMLAVPARPAPPAPAAPSADPGVPY